MVDFSLPPLPEPPEEYQEAIREQSREFIRKICEEKGLPLPVDLGEHPTPEELKQRVAYIAPLSEEQERFYAWQAENRPTYIDVQELDEILQRPDGIDSLL